MNAIASPQTPMTARTAGRIIGVLFLVQTVVAPVVNFVLLGPAITTPPGFLVNAAANATHVNAAALLSLVAGVLPIGIAITAFPVFRRHSRAMALWFLALTVVGFAGVVVESIAVRSMLALSQEYAKMDAADPAPFQAPAALARAMRNSTHYTNLLVSGGWLLVLYGVLFRSALIPRALSALGLLAVVLLIGGAMIPLLGHRAVMTMFMPMALSQLALVLWLMARGFEDRRHTSVDGTVSADHGVDP